MSDREEENVDAPEDDEEKDAENEEQFDESILNEDDEEKGESDKEDETPMGSTSSLSSSSTSSLTSSSTSSLPSSSSASSPEAASSSSSSSSETADPPTKKKSKEKKEVKPGVIYLSRIPPYMRPQKLRHLLCQFGDVGRMFLTPEDASIAAKRKKFKGNRARKFVDGWVEFLDKRIAKRVALMINNTPIGGKKRSFYRDDIWNIKYIKGLKWHHLTERIANERQAREQKIRQAMARAKRENEALLEKVQKGKTIAAIEQRKLQKKRKQEATSSEDAKEAVEESDQVHAQDDDDERSQKRQKPQLKQRLPKLKKNFKQEQQMKGLSEEDTDD
eukprot:TRINITY_DN5005_c0_g1_i2.p1 TRINITY_DN5005_c0_g1~~TRINITY_DN5005_c0_g1_i2.p1  ORF type:complete len:332 (+),score=122.85 TRINITY_DN5005_c0_g1_i2:91-1086(+)